MEHTPGSWEIVPRSKYLIRTKCKTYNICRVWNDKGGEDEPTTIANARLIASAPDMLKILKRIWYANDTNNCGVVNGEAILCKSFALQIKYILAKATGE